MNTNQITDLLAPAASGHQSRLVQAHQMINKIIHERKEVKPWSRFFVDVARMRLDSDAFKALVDEATKLQSVTAEDAPSDQGSLF